MALAFMADGCTDAPAGADPPASLPWPSSKVIRLFTPLSKRVWILEPAIGPMLRPRPVSSMGYNPTWNHWTYSVNPDPATVVRTCRLIRRAITRTCSVALSILVTERQGLESAVGLSPQSDGPSTCPRFPYPRCVH